MDPDTADEIAKIEHELEILRSRYALMERWARVLRIFFWLLPVVIAGLIVYAAYPDVVGMALGLGLCVVVTALLWFTRDLLMPFRWIDLASPQPYGWLPGGAPRSEAQAIEDLIAVRERRLAELKRS